ncbi:MAG TPA: YidC/Oxa1 family membrane protein insertase, partial [Kofleriaceae bacterium]|nr:YidC/Oxa1 family membrane protein insertase [Kofleriaceae bacterium]
LAKFYSVVGNWGIAIILLTICVKLATLYWTTKSMRSMKGMAAVAPQMKILQEKYKEDRPRLQAETMALYKQHNVNPLSGCLPIFLQIPIWSALYIMLSATGELYLEPFVPGWINDLTNTDPLHILPVLLVVTMFVQARLSPSTSTDRTQKLIQYGMPIMFGVMSFFFPSGLTLYIFTNTVLSSLHSLYMNKYDKKSLAIAAQIKKNAAETAAKAAKGADKPATKPSKIIDVKANETSDDDRDDDADSADVAPAIAAASSNPARARPRRKKRRR